MSEEAEVWQVMRLIVRAAKQGLKLMLVALNQVDVIISKKIEKATE